MLRRKTQQKNIDQMSKMKSEIMSLHGAADERWYEKS